MSVGYATLYGDMNGGFNPVKDLYKTELYDLAQLAEPPESASGRARACRSRNSGERHITRTADDKNPREPDRPGLFAALCSARTTSSSA